MAITTQNKLAYLSDTKTAIKNAIVAQGQTVADSDTFRSYADKIRAIETAADPVLTNLNVTENGNYTPSAGVDGFSSVSVNVPDVPPVLQDKEVTENGEYTADNGYDGLNKVTVNVPEPVVQPLEVIENGEYTPSSGVDGFSSVKVNVPDIPAVVQPLEITENGTYTAPDGVDGYSPVTVAVPVPEIKLQDKTITENGEYTADAGFDGLGKVLVEIVQNTPTTGAMIKYFSVKPESTKGVRVNVDIGFVPDALFVIYNNSNKPGGYNGIAYWGVCNAAAEKLGQQPQVSILEYSNTSGALYRSGFFFDMAGDYNASMPISAVDETGFNLGKYAPANQYYAVYAIGGLG